MTKEELFAAVKNLSKDFELEDLFGQLVLIKRIEEGIRQSDSGETVTEVEARAYPSRWSSSASPAASR